MLVPSGAGVLSAWGMLGAPVRHDASQTLVVPCAGEHMHQVHGLIQRLAAQVLEVLEEQGVAASAARLVPELGLRYTGQEYTLTLPWRVPPEHASPDWAERAAAAMRDAFHAAHQRRFGHADPGGQVQVVGVRMAGLEDREDGDWPPFDYPRDEDGLRTALRTAGRVQEVPLLARGNLEAGDRREGPAVVYEPSTHVFVPPGWTFQVAPDGSLLLRRED